MADSRKVSFDAQVAEILSEREADAAFRLACQKSAEDMLETRAEGGRMRVDTGFLRASGVWTKGGPELNATFNPNPQGGYQFSPDATAHALFLSNVEAGDVVYFTFTANYAIYREYGANGQPPDAFREGALMRWATHVDEAVREVKAARR